MNMAISRLYTNKISGFSLIELLVSMAIGLLLLLGLSVIFVNSSQTNRELQNTAQQIENGRYAADLLSQDLHHAGFFGRLYTFPNSATSPAAPTNAAPADPCLTGAATPDLDAFKSATAWPIQGYRAANLSMRADISATTCDDKGLLTSANLQPGSDVLVIRRALTQKLAPALASVTNEIHIQATGTASLVRVGTGAVFANAGVLNKDGTGAPVHKYVVHVYFVAPCSVGSGTNGVCASGDDAIPTLKRLELVSKGGATVMNIVPLVEGIEYLKVEYGIDNLPIAVSTVTNVKGDANVDAYSPTPSDWTEVISAKVFILARNTAATMGYVDSKSYALGTVTAGPTDYAGKEAFKRHAYTTSTRLVNVAGRREIP